MTLRPTDMLAIQSAIDEYERRFPRRPAPTAEVALAWRLGKREWAKRQVAQNASLQPNVDIASNARDNADAVFAQQECNRFIWAWQQFRLHWHSAEDLPTRVVGLMPWVRRALRVGWWGMVAVAIASVFLFGAIVGGLK